MQVDGLCKSCSLVFPGSLSYTSYYKRLREDQMKYKNSISHLLGRSEATGSHRHSIATAGGTAFRPGGLSALAGKGLLFVLLLIATIATLSSCGMSSSEAESYSAPKMDARDSGPVMAEFASEAAEAPAEFIKSDDTGGVASHGDPGSTTDSAADDSATDDSAVDDSTVDDSAVDDSAVGPPERKLVSTGSMELVVEELEAAEDSIRESARKMDGYVASISRWGDGFSMTVKIPTADFDAFVETAGELGEVRTKQIDVEEVTDRYYDLEHRIRNKELLVERFRSYLEKAEALEEILAVERQLNETVTELERLEGSFRNLSHLISFSTLHLSIRLPSYASDHGPLPSLREGLRNFGYTVVNVFYGIFFIMLGIVVFGVPLVLAAGLLYWLGFGKIGVVRKFFGTLRPGVKNRQSSGNDRRPGGKGEQTSGSDK